MVIKVIKQDRTDAFVLSEYKNLKIEGTLRPWRKNAYFSALDVDIDCEDYLELDGNEYVVKEKNVTLNGYTEFVASLNLEDLENATLYGADQPGAQTIGAYLYTLFGALDTDWTYVDNTTGGKRRAVALGNKSVLEKLESLCDAFLCEVWYDTKNKVAYVEDRIGVDTGAYFAANANLRELTRSSDTRDFATIIEPIGKDGLTIESVNSGSKTLENYTFSDKKVKLIWEDESYTDAQALKDDAAYKLDELAKPRVSYSCKVIDLAKAVPGYGHLSYSLGDTVRILGGDTKDEQRIVKTVEYPNEPEKNECELANKTLSFEDLQSRLKSAAETVESVSNGIMIYASKVQGLPDYSAPTDISGNAGSANKLKTARTIGGVSFDGSSNIHHFATCSTGAATTAKTCTVTGFVLGTGAKITVQFTYGNTATNATLNVSGTGAKALYYRGARLPVGAIAAGTVVDLVYTGSYWRIVGDLAVSADPGKASEMFYVDENIGQGRSWAAGTETIVATIDLDEAGLYYIDCTNTTTFSGAMINGSAACIGWLKLANADNSEFYKYRTFDYSGHADMLAYLSAGSYTIVIGLNVTRTGVAPGRFGGLFVTRIR